MKSFLSGSGVILSLEIRQRVRGVAWWVLLGVFFVLVLLVTAGLTIAFNAFGSHDGSQGGEIYSTIIYFVLLLGTLVAPAMSGNAINGDRDAGTLATTQVTLVTTGQIVFGKFLAAWVTALAFLVASIPFLIFATVLGGLTIATIFVSIFVLAFELGIVAAIGVGLSGLLNRPLFSVVVTYLVVAALSIGTLIAFSLGGLLTQSQQTIVNYTSTQSDKNGNSIHCTYDSSDKISVPRFDRVWGALVANPYVILADAIPTTYSRGTDGTPTNLFGQLKLGERSAQIPPAVRVVYNDCDLNNEYGDQNARHIIDSTTPGWLVGMLIQLVLAGAAIWGAWMKLRTPAGRLSRESRIA